VTARELVTVRRHRDPLDGQTLPVLGRCRRGTQLLVVLPDGSKRVIPAAWTDAGAGGSAAALASPADLLALCVLVSALSARGGGEQGQAAGMSPCKEDSRAACPTQFDTRSDPTLAAAVNSFSGVTRLDSTVSRQI